MLELLKKLCAVGGVSGNENSVSDIIENEIKGYAEFHKDNLGNLIVFKKGKKRPLNKLMICAHMDEVGLIITGAMGGGFLKFDTVGGIDPRVIPGTRVLIGDKKILGVIGEKTLHLLKPDEDGIALGVDKLYIDIGVESKDEALKVINPGDTAYFDSDLIQFGDGFVKARAIDDRIGCAIMIELIKADAEYDKYFAFTVQEEVGTRGAKTATFAIKPDAALVLEATTAADIPFVEEENKVCYLGKGPVISFMDRRTIYDKGLYKMAFGLAQEKGIPCQAKLAVAGGNDAGSVHLSGEGVKTLAISLPCRYLHSPSCVIKWVDAESTLKLAKELSEKITAEKLM